MGTLYGFYSYLSSLEYIRRHIIWAFSETKQPFQMI